MYKQAVSEENYIKNTDIKYIKKMISTDQNKKE